ncbi:hypothetical protein [Georgenia yuyongxinii]|uniref:Uncharacterized protein n=1 Tax=Georgenia yuyongxinii TaxID=2589797 RepID=A0A552WUB5_9MICO|nr:hypothetical protein [Georgenia yuyongxinii]TRW46364.1 hypothetical protein FJ693_05410 [Georgenia yuyongxinii]
MLPAPLTHMHLHPFARAVLLDAFAAAEANGYHPHAEPGDDYVRVSAGVDHDTAVYVHPREFSIALDAQLAAVVCRERPAAFRLEAKSATTGYVHVAYFDNEAVRWFVTELVSTALDRSRAAGPHARHGRGPSKPEAPVELCPTHNLELANGTCWGCDD